MRELKSALKKPSKALPSKELDISEEIVNAAVIGGNAMASSEPFGPVIGAAMGAAEEGMAILNERKSSKNKPVVTRK